MTKARALKNTNNLHSLDKLFPKLTTYLGYGNNKKAKDVNDRIFNGHTKRNPYNATSLTGIFKNKTKPGFHNCVKYKESMDLSRRKPRLNGFTSSMKVGARRLKQMN